MPSLHIAFLGSFQVTSDDKLVTTFESDKVRALLAYLSVEADQSHRRETLAALLWPDMPEGTARSNLRHALVNLRRAIGDYGANPPYLLITRQTLRFNRDSLHFLDLAAFQQHLTTKQHSIPQLEELAALYRGDFLTGFSIPSSTAFEEWAVVKRELYHRQILNVLHELAEAYAQRGQYEQALPFAQREVALEPWSESAHQQLIRLLALAGQRSAALAQYERCARILETELGITPTAVSTTLSQDIRDEIWPDDIARLALPRYMVEETATSTSPSAGVSPPPLFVARDQELMQLNHFLNQACSDKYRVVFITGEAGSGKTALMHAFIRQAMVAHPNLLVAYGKCSAYTGSGDPYLPFLEIMQMLTGDVESRWEAGDISANLARRLWSALPDVTKTLMSNGRLLLDRFISSAELLSRAQARIRHKSPEQVPWLTQLAEWVQAGEMAVPVSQTDLLAQYARLLETVARNRPLLLLLDDLQWADSSSLNLFFHLGQRLRGSGILILGAYRPDDVALGRDGQPHPLAELINEFRQLFGHNQVDLSTAGGRPFIDALLDSEPNRLDESFRQELQRQTGGQALFTVELLRGLRERGELFQNDAGYWVENDNLNWDISPARVEAVIAGRISRLPDSCRTTLTIASVEGEDFTAEVVAHIQKAGEENTVRCLSGDLSRQHRLVAAQSRQRLGQQALSRYRFHHFLFQKYLYNKLDPVERADLHEAVGEALEQLFGSQEAVMATMFGQLARHFQEAGSLEKAIDYHQKAGERASQLTASDEAIGHLQQGLALLEKMPDSPERKQKELELQMNLALPLQASKGFAAPEVRRIYDRAYLLSQQVGQTPQLCSILGFLGSYYLTSGQYYASLKICPQLFELGLSSQDQLQIALAHLGFGANYLQLGKFTQAWEHIEKLITFYDFRQHHALTPHYGIDPGVNGLIWAALTTWVLGYPDQAKRYSQEAIEWARMLDHPFSLTAALEVSGGILHLQCRQYSAASDKIKASLQLATEHKFSLFQVEGEFYQGYLQISDGQTDEGIPRMKQALMSWRTTGMRIMYSQMLGLLAQALGKAGKVEEGLQTLDDAFTEVNDRDERFFEAELYRIKGDLLVKCGEETAVIESSYHRAITIARQQAAKSWELRAALSLAKFRQTKNQSSQAKLMLAEIYSWFTEGFDTPDMLEAHAILGRRSAN